MLRVNKHIRVVTLACQYEQLHDKFAALALPTVAIEKFTAGLSTGHKCLVLRVSDEATFLQHPRPASSA